MSSSKTARGPTLVPDRGSDGAPSVSRCTRASRSSCRASGWPGGPSGWAWTHITPGSSSPATEVAGSSPRRPSTARSPPARQLPDARSHAQASPALARSPRTPGPPGPPARDRRPEVTVSRRREVLGNSPLTRAIHECVAHRRSPSPHPSPRGRGERATAFPRRRAFPAGRRQNHPLLPAGEKVPEGRMRGSPVCASQP